MDAGDTSDMDYARGMWRAEDKGASELKRSSFVEEIHLRLPNQIQSSAVPISFNEPLVAGRTDDQQN